MTPRTRLALGILGLASLAGCYYPYTDVPLTCVDRSIKVGTEINGGYQYNGFSGCSSPETFAETTTAEGNTVTLVGSVGFLMGGDVWLSEEQKYAVPPGVILSDPGFLAIETQATYSFTVPASNGTNPTYIYHAVGQNPGSDPIPYVVAGARVLGSGTVDPLDLTSPEGEDAFDLQAGSTYQLITQYDTQTGSGTSDNFLSLKVRVPAPTSP